LCDLLRSLTLYNPAFREEVANSGVIPHLVNFIATPSTDPTFQERVLQILYNVSITETTAPNLVRFGTVPTLISFLGAHPDLDKSVELGFFTIANLMSLEETHIAARNHGLPEVLIKIATKVRESKLQIDKEDWDKTLVEIATNALCDDVLRTEFKKVGAKEFLNNFHRPENVQISQLAEVAKQNLDLPGEDN